jgi:Tetratricopeptide repeat
MRCVSNRLRMLPQIVRHESGMTFEPISNVNESSVTSEPSHELLSARLAAGLRNGRCVPVLAGRKSISQQRTSCAPRNIVTTPHLTDLRTLLHVRAWLSIFAALALVTCKPQAGGTASGHGEPAAVASNRASASNRAPQNGSSAPVVAPPAPSLAAPAAAAAGTGAVASSDVPPLARGTLDGKRIESSKTAEAAADRAFGAKDYTTAEQESRRALALDPGNLHARYQLARTLVQRGEAASGVVVLEPLQALGCLLCLERLVAARKDPGFEPVHQDAHFVELTKDAHERLPKLELAAERLFSWFLLTERPVLPESELIDARALIVIEDGTAKATQRYYQLHGSEAFRRHVKRAYTKGIYPGYPRSCAKGCCTVTGAQILGVHLREMCFQTSGTAAVHLYKIRIEGDPVASFPG